MECHVCGTEVRPEQKFCMECGARLHHTQGHDLALAPPEAGSANDTTRTPALPPASGAHPMFDPVTGQLLAQPSQPVWPAVDDDATNVLPALGEPQNKYSSGQAFAPPTLPAQGPGQWEREAGEYATPWPTNQPQLGPPTTYDRQVDQPTRQQHLNQPPYRPEAYSGVQYAERYDQTGVLPETYAPWEGEWNEEQPVDHGPTFRIRPLLLLSILPAVAAIVGMFIEVVNVDATQGSPDIVGDWKLNDFGTNLTVTGIVLVVTMLLGGIAWCGGYRWGAGLAGGAGAGLAGWAAMSLGMAEGPISPIATSIALDVNRELGYWCLCAAGGLGLIVMFTSLLRAGNDRRAGLDPWVAALGAIATIAAVLGPLIPLNDANLDLNWSSPAGADLPTLFFVGRFVQLGLLLICGVFGFLLVRRYGLGFAIGGTIGVAWMVLTAATEQTDNPLGPAFNNPGATDLKPYIVTTVGVGLMMFFALVATAMALIDAD